jgi:ABC-type branched-subunit amino acid transport system ATPase component
VGGGGGGAVVVVGATVVVVGGGAGIASASTAGATTVVGAVVGATESAVGSEPRRSRRIVTIGAPNKIERSIGRVFLLLRLFRNMIATKQTERKELDAKGVHHERRSFRSCYEDS